MQTMRMQIFNLRPRLNFKEAQERKKEKMAQIKKEMYNTAVMIQLIGDK